MTRHQVFEATKMINLPFLLSWEVVDAAFEAPDGSAFREAC